jgi:hypothetical protein
MVTLSTSLFILAMMRAGRPAAALAASVAMSSWMREWRLNGATSRCLNSGERAKPVRELNSRATSAVISGLQVKQAEVGVEAGGLRVVVAGAEVGVAPQAVGLLPDDHAALAVGLVADEAEDDVHAGLLELAGPLDVVGLVEAGLELDSAVTCLPLLRGLDERADDGRVAAGAVERLLDGQHAGIAGGLLTKSTTGVNDS